MQRPGSRDDTARARALTALLLAAISLGASCSSPAQTVTTPLHLSCADGSGSPSATAPRFTVLVFTRTAGYVHASIPDGVAAVRELGHITGFAVDTTSDAAHFTDAGLAPYREILFMSTTGDVLDDAEQAAFERWFGAGHGWVGVHSASDTEYGWPFYQTMLGAHFTAHPAIQQATVHVVDSAHVSTRRFPATLARTDEWYNFNQQPVGAHVLVRVDESSYKGGTMGVSHPVSWLRELNGARAWYTAMGHTKESYRETPFLEHLRGGILWAAGADTIATCPLSVQ